ncbi:MAG: hypothetical protein EOO38_05190 [Cytophagaceae bacterium]|nr:MAG: hypothetical protein EOO38_05190 [Cytophagaceae bacterium]
MKYAGHVLVSRTVHNETLAAARRDGVSDYLGNGVNYWGGVHRDDPTRAFVLALEHGARALVYHAVAESGVAFCDLAAVVGRRPGVADAGGTI